MAPPATQLWAVLLAAGASRRLGRPKQLVRLDGVPLVRRAFDALAAVFGARVRVVLGAEADAVGEVLPPACVVSAADWRSGLAASLRRGIAALPAEAAGALIATCDQYRLGASDYRRLVAAWEADPGRCVLARYGGGEGVPAIVPRVLFGELAGLAGDRGAGPLLRARPERTVVELPAAAEDLDTPADLARLRGCRAGVDG